MIDDESRMRLSGRKLMNEMLVLIYHRDSF